jgi:uncharacterized small protein (DUF1192 family)
MTWLQRIIQAVASLAGVDVAGAAVAGSLRAEVARLEAEVKARDEAAAAAEARHRAVVAELEAANERLLDLVRRSDVHPGDLLDSLADHDPAP